MIKPTRSITAALILTLAPSFALSRDATGPARPPRDGALDHAVLHVPSPASPDPESEPEPELPPADPYGFAAILNSYRASAGLPPVAYDPNLSAWASQNNAAQCSQGLGHHILSNFFQNCGYNQSTVLDIARSWMTSPAHAQNMLTPSATRFGIAHGPGPYWTMNLR
ncbi:CAP domain-containing protein [Tautonia plasticadhaerens]|uniref:Cysteine-rich secretory protein family protein n=1 Tax=Tautonia plasticadhaerens TaxID=2527974 RepID=A0A518GYE0_9BACT|nr:CAP domain-containing protein [Tautonia plasticadhaerens]QDV33573.1 Cysteine-rich secretory protein family protein [Tautonia plasticadhaerens]